MPIVLFIFLVGIVLLPFLFWFLIRKKPSKNNNDIEKKLNRIIDILEQDKKE
ncbi:DUF4083 family protein [Neobacillus terrae]|uniref:DUF4083 family protein n=1 Tax=Neobacillus terrae TaxID=3034837 RepID=UPI001409B90D|nr:DUF4083 family protein [Neobacillus terrae]